MSARDGAGSEVLFEILLRPGAGVQGPGDGMDGRRRHPVVHAHPSSFLGEDPAAFEFLEVVADRWFGELHDGSQVAGTGLLDRLGKEVRQQLKTHWDGQGLQAHRESDRVFQIKDSAVPQRTATNR